jgi:hypothetical protein
MSYDEWDDRYDQWISELSDELYPEHREQAISDFTTECFQRFYLAHPRISESPTRLLTEARGLLPEHPSAALVFAAAAMEVALKVTVLRPLLSGFVHKESIAEIFASLLTDRGSSFDRLKRLIFPVLSECAGLDLSFFKRHGSAKPLWEEIQEVQNWRDLFLHRGDFASHIQSQTAIEVASAILETLFPLVITNLGLHLHETLICNEPEHVAPKLEKAIFQMSDGELFAFLAKLREARLGPPIGRNRKE